MLTVEHNESKQTVDIFFDEEGREQLLDVIRNLRSDWDHEHVFSPACGGDELAEIAQEPNNVVVHHLCVHLVTKLQT